VRDNIAFGLPGAPLDEVVAAARAAQIHDFISALPEGYDTVLSDRARDLSGGQRQRLALARAILRDAPVLILDEPTSALDTGTEAEVMRAVERLMEGRTTFVIAHRTSTLAACDVRLEVVEGKVLRQDAKPPPPRG
jgi:ATP-binding cassette subfamily B protein